MRGLKSKGVKLLTTAVKSHPAWGAWIEIARPAIAAPCPWSHPAWGAWIEIGKNTARPDFQRSRTPHGVRGLKLEVLQPLECFPRRTPHGVRGLKLQVLLEPAIVTGSHPAWGAWIEIN